MTSNQFNVLAALLAAIAVGLFAVAAGVLGLFPAARADDGSGKWTCYQSDRMPNAAEASSWGPLPQISAGLNEVASSAARGTVFAFNPKTVAGSYAFSICVKQ